MSFVRDNGCGINPEAVQNESDSHWVFEGCASGRKISVRDSIYGAGQVRGQQCTSPFRGRSRNGQPIFAVLGK